MNYSRKEQLANIIISQIMQTVGRSYGTRYFSLLIESSIHQLGLAWGAVFSFNNENNNYTLVTQSDTINESVIEGSVLDPLIVYQKNGKKLYSIIGDIESDDMYKNIYNPLSVKYIICFPLYNTEKEQCGVFILADKKEIFNEDMIAKVISSQIPRTEAELDRMYSAKELNHYKYNYNNLVNTTLDVMWEADANGHITSINDSCKAIYGYGNKDMLGKCFSVFMSDRSAENFIGMLPLLSKGKSFYRVIGDHYTNHNDKIKVCSNILPKYDVNSKFTGIIGTTRDISASVSAQRTIKNNSELFSSILARLPVIFFRVDENGFLVDIRGNGLKRMGVEDMDWVGRPGYGLFIGMDSKIDSALSGNTVFFENRGTYRGTPWWFFTSMFFDSWSGYGAVGFSVDITEQKYVEEQLVGLLNNNRKLAQQLVKVQEDERRNLARELHDELGQTITAVRSLATVITASTGDHHTEIRNLANSIIDMSSKLYEVVNNIMQRLRPDIIDGLNFSETIKNCIVRSQLETLGVNCDLSIDGNVNNIDEVIKITIYRIIQECLTNISKHAMASNVWVNIKRAPENSNLRNTEKYYSVQRNDQHRITVKRDTVTLEIKDDGIGIEQPKNSRNKKSKRHGLQGIEERVTAIGGSLQISSDPGKGAHIKVVLVLGNGSHDVARDINKCIADIAKMRFACTEPEKLNIY